MKLLNTLVSITLISTLLTLGLGQTAYGDSLNSFKWMAIGLFFCTAFVLWVLKFSRLPDRHPAINRISLYFVLWGCTVLNSDYPLFSTYRFVAHALIVLPALIFLTAWLSIKNSQYLVIGLKAIVGGTMLISYFRPAERTIFDDESLFRGAFGNANSLGHMSAVSALLFLHGCLSASNRYVRYIQFSMLGVSIGMLSSSGARSSSIALLAGLFVFLYYDRSLIRKYAPLVFSVLVAAALVMPNIQERLESFVFKHAHWAESHAESDAAVDRLIVSRKIVWDAHIDGFNDRPWLGWGFGIDKDTNLTFWGGELTSLGFASRDPVNDILYSAEMGGVFGVTAYLIAIGILFSSWIRNVDIRNAGVSVFQEKDRNRRAKQLCEAQILYLSLSVALFVMFEFDNTALAAGNFFSTLAWITLGCAFVLRQDFYCDVVGSRPIKPPLQDVVQYYRT